MNGESETETENRKVKTENFQFSVFSFQFSVSSKEAAKAHGIDVP